MKKTLIHTNTQKAYDVANAWEKQLAELKVVQELYATTGLTALAPGDLRKMFNNTTDFLFDKLTGNEPAHLAIGAGDNKKYLPVDKVAAIEIMQKPDGWQALTDAIKSLSQIAIKGVGMDRLAAYNTANVETVFTLDSGEIKFSEKTLEQIKDAGCYYIKSDGAKKIHQFLQDTVKAYYDNGIDDIYKSQYRKEIPELFMQFIVKLDDKNKSFVINVEEFIGCDRHITSIENV